MMPGTDDEAVYGAVEEATYWAVTWTMSGAAREDPMHSDLLGFMRSMGAEA